MFKDDYAPSAGGPTATGRRLHDLAVCERPQERLQRSGAAALSESELLAMILRSGNRSCDVLTLASKLLREAGSLAALLKWQEADFRKLKGIGKVKALQLLTVLEISRRILCECGEPEADFSGPEPVFAYFRPLTAGLEVEKFWALCLNRKNRLLRRVEVTSGTASSSLVHPREVFREAIRQGASAVIAVHNHPSGDPAPSRADIQVTRQLRESAKIIGIDLLDHIIIGTPVADPVGTGYYSFNEAGLL